MQKEKAEVLNALYGHLPDPLEGHRERIEAQHKAVQKTRLGRYRAQVLCTYLVARGDDLDEVRKAARAEADRLGADHMVELIDLNELQFLTF